MYINIVGAGLDISVQISAGRAKYYTLYYTIHNIKFVIEKIKAKFITGTQFDLCVNNLDMNVHINLPTILICPELPIASYSTMDSEEKAYHHSSLRSTYEKITTTINKGNKIEFCKTIFFYKEIGS